MNRIAPFSSDSAADTAASGCCWHAITREEEFLQCPTQLVIWPTAGGAWPASAASTKSYRLTSRRPLVSVSDQGPGIPLERIGMSSSGAFGVRTCRADKGLVLGCPSCSASPLLMGVDEVADALIALTWK